MHDNRKILILDTSGRQTPEAAAAGVPTMDRWFLDAFGGDPSEFDVVDAVDGPTPDGLDYAGMVITGSRVSVYEPLDWLQRVFNYVRRAIDARMPTLGVCFGHQVLAHALGGRVEKNANGWELGLCDVTLTDAGRADPLLAGLPDPLPAFQMHQDAVVEMPPGATLLATSERAACQAFAVGDCVRAVQFHPEMTVAIETGLLNIKAGALASEGVDVSPLIAALRPADDARQVLDRFRTRFCGK